MDENLFLIYVNELGSNWKEQYVYEFIFSDTIENVDGEDWDMYPASGQPTPPKKHFVKEVGVLTSNLKLQLVQNSDTFSVWDAVDGIIALAYEDMYDYNEYPETRINFKFGETIKSVQDSLYERDLVLNYTLKNGRTQKNDSKSTK